MVAALQPFHGDVVELLRAAVASSKSDPLARVRLLDESGNVVQDIRASRSVSLPDPNAGNSADDAVVVLPRDSPTRVARDRASSCLTDETSTPTSQPSAFFPLDSLVFALLTRDKINSHYIREGTVANVVRLSTLERASILEWLLGKRAQWEGALEWSECQRRDAVARASGAQPGAQAGPSTTPPGTPPQALLALGASAAASTSATSASAASASALASSAVTGAPPQRRAYVPSRNDLAFVKRLRTSGTELSVRDRNHALRGVRHWEKTADFEAQRLGVKRALEAARGGARSAVSAAAGHGVGFGGAGYGVGVGVGGAPAGVSGVGGSGGGGRRRALDPILVLSNSPTSLISMHNVKRLLEEGVFVPPDEARAQSGGAGAESIVTVNHGRQRLLVVDNADALARLGGGGASGAASAASAADPWHRVVAVFTTGQAWQFKAYKWTEPRELFKNVLGVYVRWSNEPESAAVRDWPIVKLSVDRTKRHTDRQLVAHLWRSIDGYVARRKPYLLPPAAPASSSSSLSSAAAAAGGGVGVGGGGAAGLGGVRGVGAGGGGFGTASGGPSVGVGAR